MKTYSILLLFIATFFGYAQNSISGRVVLPAQQSKTNVAPIKIIMVAGTQADSVMVNKNMDFTFDAISADHATLFFPDAGDGKNYQFQLKKNVPTKVQLLYDPSAVPNGEIEIANKKLSTSKRINSLFYVAKVLTDNISGPK